MEESKKEMGISYIENMPDRYNNFKTIQKMLAHCFFDTPETKKIFKEIVEDEENNFSRYYFFFANYLSNKNNKLDERRYTSSCLSITIC